MYGCQWQPKKVNIFSPRPSVKKIETTVEVPSKSPGETVTTTVDMETEYFTPCFFAHREPAGVDNIPRHPCQSQSSQRQCGVDPSAQFTYSPDYYSLETESMLPSSHLDPSSGTHPHFGCKYANTVNYRVPYYSSVPNPSTSHHRHYHKSSIRKQHRNGHREKSRRSYYPPKNLPYSSSSSLYSSVRCSGSTYYQCPSIYQEPPCSPANSIN